MRPFFISPSLSLTLLPENTPPLKCVFRQKVLLCSLKYVLFFLILAFHVSVSYNDDILSVLRLIIFY